MRKALNAAALALLLTACGAPAPRPTPHPAAPPPAGPPAARGGTPYRIDSSHSELRVLVYRAGVMAPLSVRPGDGIQVDARFARYPTTVRSAWSAGVWELFWIWAWRN